MTGPNVILLVAAILHLPWRQEAAVAVLATLTPDERKALTPILQRKGDARRAIVHHGERNGR